MTRDVEAALSREYRCAPEASIPLGGLSDPQDMARLVLLLVSDFAAHTTGRFVLSDKGAFLSRNRPELTVDRPAFHRRTTGDTRPRRRVRELGSG